MSTDPAPPQSIDVLGLGCIALDEMIHIDSYPQADVKTRVHRHELSLGGLATQALVAAQRLGATTAYSGILGKNPESEQVIDLMKAEGIDLSSLQYIEGARPIHSWVIVGENPDTRNILYNLEGSIGIQSPPVELIQKSKVLLVDQQGLDGMIESAHVAIKAGIPRVADFDYIPPGLDRLSKLADHIILGVNFAMEFTSTRSIKDAAQALFTELTEVVILTAGEEGLYYLTKDSPDLQHFPAFKVTPLNTSGCGDVFHGAYAWGLAKGMPFSDRLKWASAQAAIKASRRGGHRSIPVYEEVELFITDQKKY